MADPNPYTADRVHYVDDGYLITAVYVADPDRDPVEAVEAPPAVEPGAWPPREQIIATATKYFQSRGDSLSGWVVSSDHNHTGPYPNKKVAREELEDAVRDHFERYTN